MINSRLKLVAMQCLVGGFLSLPVCPASAAEDTPSVAGKSTKSTNLGDLTEYIAIAKEAQSIAKSGDLAKARLRMKELEKVWDEGEDKHRPLDTAAWTDADTQLDKAIGKLRANHPDADAVNGSLTTLVATLESLNKPK